MLLANAGMLSDKTIKLKTHMTQHSTAGRDRGLILRAAVHRDLSVSVGFCPRQDQLRHYLRRRVLQLKETGAPDRRTL